MYVDLIVVIIVILGVVMYARNFSSFVFAVAITDILLRVLSFIGSNIGLPKMSAFIKKHFPDSIFTLIDNYLGGEIAIIVKWLFVIIMIFFLYYVIKIWLKKKKF